MMCAESVYIDDTPDGDGDCFVVAFHAIEYAKGDNARLVHALVSTDNVPPHWHAWVEVDEVLPPMPMNGVHVSTVTRVAVDRSNGHVWQSSAAYYRQLGRATDVREYTLEEAHRMAIRTEHYGPWHD